MRNEMLTILVRLILERKFKTRVQQLIFCDCIQDATINLFIARSNDIIEQVATKYGDELNHLLTAPEEEIKDFITENLHLLHLSVGHLM